MSKLAAKVLSSDNSILAMMVVDNYGNVLAHGRVKGFEDAQDWFESYTLLIPLNHYRMMAFLRLASEEARVRVCDGVSEILSFPANCIPP
jgi:hypothetical protein